MTTCSCFQPVTCGICVCNPALATVGAAPIVAPNTPLCSPGVGVASCGMSQVTIAGSKTNIWPWVIAIAAGLYLLSKHHKG
jgi:hypothetical protein